MSGKYCWPEPWIEAAMRAGFAHHKGDGDWVFINDKMRDMLAEFAVAISEQAGAAERERCARKSETLPILPGLNLIHASSVKRT